MFWGFSRVVEIIIDGPPNLHESYSGHENQQWEPLVDAQPASKHRHWKQSCGQNLQLVCHLMKTKWEDMLGQLARKDVTLRASQTWNHTDLRCFSISDATNTTPFPSAVPGRWRRPGWTRRHTAGCSARCRSPREWPASMSLWVCGGFPDAGCCSKLSRCNLRGGNDDFYIWWIILRLYLL